jgi:hypothetical protein
MVLFNQVITVRYFDDRSLVSVGRQPSAFSSHRTVRRSVAVQGDCPWRTLLAPDRFAEEGLGGSDVTSGTQPEVNRSTHLALSVMLMKCAALQSR